MSSGASGSPVSDSVDVSDVLVVDEEVGGDLDEIDIDGEEDLSNSSTTISSTISRISSVKTFALYSAVYFFVQFRTEAQQDKTRTDQPTGMVEAENNLCCSHTVLQCCANCAIPIFVSMIERELQLEGYCTKKPIE
jgi:hypothetical protein